MDIKSSTPTPVLSNFLAIYTTNRRLCSTKSDFAASAGQVVRLGCRVWDFYRRLVEIMQKHFPGECMMQSWRCSQSVVNLWREQHNDLIFKIDHDDPFKVGKAGALQYLEMRKKYRITNIFWGDDRMACSFIDELLKNGVRVPDEVNVISFDNLDLAQYLAIPLTTWGIPIVQHTELVVDAILNDHKLADTVSQPLFSPGKSARLTPEILRELSGCCRISCGDMQ